MDHELDTAPCGYLSFNDRGVILSVNQTLCKLLNYDKAELVDNKFDKLLDVAGQIFFQTHFFPLLKMQGKVEEIFLSLLNRDRKKIPVVVSSIKRDRDGHISYGVAFIPVFNRRKFEDELIAARHLAEQRLRENKELINARNIADEHARELEVKNRSLKNKNDETLEISNILNHEVKECIRKIVMFSKIAKDDKSENYTGLIVRTAYRLKRINAAINEILVLTNASRTFVKCSVEEIVQKALAKIPDQDRVRIHYTHLPLPLIELIPEQIEVLFIHLLENAIRYRTHEAVNIVIDHVVYKRNIFTVNAEKYQYKDFIKLTLTDDTRGLDNEYSGQLFKILKTMGKPDDGIGMGLAISKKIVENHSGDISLSSAVGKGVVITINLPVNQYFTYKDA